MPNTYKIDLTHAEPKMVLAGKRFLELYAALDAKSRKPYIPDLKKTVVTYDPKITCEAIYKRLAQNHCESDQYLQILEGMYRAIAVYVRKNMKHPGDRTWIAADQCKKEARKIFKDRQKLAKENGYEVVPVKVKKLAKRLRGEPVGLPKIKAASFVSTKPAEMALLLMDLTVDPPPRHAPKKPAASRRGRVVKIISKQGNFNFH